MSFIAAMDILALAAFSGAFVLAVRSLRTEPPSFKQVGGVFTVAIGIYVLVMISNTLEHLSVTASLDPFEDYIEILFLPLIMFSSHAWASLVEREKLAAAYRMLEGEHALLERVLETTPTGIVLADPEGRITFANDHAKKLLDLGDSDARPGLPTPDWRLVDLRADERDLPDPGRFKLELEGEDIRRGIACALAWPDGHRSFLAVSASPMAPAEGEPSAYVFSLTEDVRLDEAPRS